MTCVGQPAWRWIDASLVYAIHDRLLAEHGGLDGIRDRGGVESALARPINLAEYGEPDASALAAAYAYGFLRNHGFADGNKRTAWVAARLFHTWRMCGEREHPRWEQLGLDLSAHASDWGSCG